MERLFNLTPHDVDIVLGSNHYETIPRDGRVARVVTDLKMDSHIGRIPIYEEVLYGANGLPRPSPGNIYLVSRITLLAGQVLGRTDLVAPYSTGGKIRGLLRSRLA